MKVYLSRSNAADPAVFSVVKAAIENLGHEVVTFNGGAYSKEPLLSCDALVVVPSAQMLPGFKKGNTSTSLEDYQPDVGKGQYEQCIDFAKKHAEDYNDNNDDSDLIDIEMSEGKFMLVIQEVDNSDSDHPAVYVNNIIDVSEQDTNDWVKRYGFLVTDGSYLNIGNLLGREERKQPAPIYPVSNTYLEPVSDNQLLGAAAYLNIVKI